MAFFRATTLDVGPSGIPNIDIPRNQWVRLSDGKTFNVATPPMAVRPVVYYLERTDGLIKIGTTGDLRNRRRKVAYEHGPLSLLAYEYGSYGTERKRHEQFWWERESSGSEWFHPRFFLVDYIKHLRACNDAEMEGRA
jgi:hypothetical protein